MKPFCGFLVHALTAATIHALKVSNRNKMLMKVAQGFIVISMRMAQIVTTLKTAQ